MKTVSLFLTATILLSAPTLQAKMVKVPDAQAKELIEALAITSFDCSPRVSMSGTLSSLRGAQNVYLDDTRSQPVLKFVRTYEGDPNTRAVFTLTTSSDFKEIELLVIESQDVKAVNRGTLVKPQIRNEFVTTNRYECK